MENITNPGTTAPETEAKPYLPDIIHYDRNNCRKGTLLHAKLRKRIYLREEKPAGEVQHSMSLHYKHKSEFIIFNCYNESVCLKNYTQFSGLDVFGSSLDSIAVFSRELGDELQQGGTLILHRLAVAAEKRLVLSGKNVDTGLQLWQTIPNMVHQQPETEMFKVEKTFLLALKSDKDKWKKLSLIAETSKSPSKIPTSKSP